MDRVRCLPRLCGCQCGCTSLNNTTNSSCHNNASNSTATTSHSTRQWMKPEQPLQVLESAPRAANLEARAAHLKAPTTHQTNRWPLFLASDCAGQNSANQTQTEPNKSSLDLRCDLVLMWSWHEAPLAIKLPLNSLELGLVCIVVVVVVVVVGQLIEAPLNSTQLAR